MATVPLLPLISATPRFERSLPLFARRGTHRGNAEPFAVLMRAGGIASPAVPLLTRAYVLLTATTSPSISSWPKPSVPNVAPTMSRIATTWPAAMSTFTAVNSVWPSAPDGVKMTVAVVSRDAGLSSRTSVM